MLMRPDQRPETKSYDGLIVLTEGDRVMVVIRSEGIETAGLSL